ncbi:MAG: 4-hydroxy-tetrahydrodipicolinate reductase [Verrucomicrobia bacterium]|nr:4-hydroxy-tetrahydrodipicolinate reductase [Verrucomicrobiota bacterium]
MGKALLESLPRESSLHLLGAISSKESIDPLLDSADVIIDFTTPEATMELLPKCRNAKKALVIGTTGLSKQEESLILEASKEIPILFSPNYSVGVNALFWLTQKATELLGPEYDAEIVEMHHRFKKDAPSGTARRLGEIIAEVRELDYQKEAKHGRFGIFEERKPSEIGIHALRVGDAIGEHTVMLGTLGERLELTYRASTRVAYASGALRGAVWLTKKEPGLYDMQHFLKIKTN